ncbi:type II secretion system protein [Nitrospira sp. M1]
MRTTSNEQRFTLASRSATAREQRATSDKRQATSNEQRATSNGFTLLELIGVIAVMAILGAIIAPNVINHLKAAEQDAEVKTLEGIAHAIEVYLRENRAWPPDLASLSPDYLPTNTVQLTQNNGGFPRYFVVHPDISGLTNAVGISVASLEDAQFLLISNLNADAAPTITNAAAFDAWWDTDESTTPDLKIHRGQVSHAFNLLTLQASGSRGDYKIDGVSTNWDCHLQPELTHTRYHLNGTIVALDEESPYTTPEVQFSLARDTGYRYNSCHVAGTRWRIDSTATPSCSSLWFSTVNAVNPSGTTCLNSWSAAELLQLGPPNLVFEPGTTGGTVASVVDMENFTPSTNIAAMHYVGRDITIELGGILFPTFTDLFEGDLLLIPAWYTLFISTNSLIAWPDDVIIFRPDTTGDYRSGTFIMLFNGGGTAPDTISGITLVEQETLVGGQTLEAGTFLFSRTRNADKNKIFYYVPADVGLFSDGISLLIDGSDIGMGGTSGGGAGVVGLDLIERDLTTGGTALQSGQILVTLDNADNAVGNGTSISTTANDVFILDVTATGVGTTDATATMFFEGADINLDSWIGVDSLALAPTH